MYAMTGIIKGNTVLTNDNSVEKYNGRKVIITVLDDEKLFTISDSIINQNMDAYQELAKWSFEYEQVVKIYSTLISKIEEWMGFEMSNTQKDLIEFGFNVASRKMAKDDIKQWLIKHKQ